MCYVLCCLHLHQRSDDRRRMRSGDRTYCIRGLIRLQKQRSRDRTCAALFVFTSACGKIARSPDRFLHQRSHDRYRVCGLATALFLRCRVAGDNPHVRLLNDARFIDPAFQANKLALLVIGYFLVSFCLCCFFFFFDLPLGFVIIV